MRQAAFLALCRVSGTSCKEQGSYDVCNGLLYGERRGLSAWRRERSVGLVGVAVVSDRRLNVERW